MSPVPLWLLGFLFVRFFTLLGESASIWSGSRAAVDGAGLGSRLSKDTADIEELRRSLRRNSWTRKAFIEPPLHPPLSSTPLHPKPLSVNLKRQWEGKA